MSERIKLIDVLKAVSIVAVVLYHVGICHMGYLGVDVFFVIAGYLTTKQVYTKIVNNRFKYTKFVLYKTIRLLPLVVVLNISCLVIGFFWMLPNDYEAVSKSVIASNFMSENILSYRNIGNYWDVWNEYKPQMHLWYLGVLFKFYLIYPIFVKFFNIVQIKTKKAQAAVVCVGGIVTYNNIIYSKLFADFL